jgi:hypothetical protein
MAARITHIRSAERAAVADVSSAANMPTVLARVIHDYAHLPEPCDCWSCRHGWGHDHNGRYASPLNGYST